MAPDLTKVVVPMEIPDDSLRQKVVVDIARCTPGIVNINVDPETRLLTVIGNSNMNVWKFKKKFRKYGKDSYKNIEVTKYDAALEAEEEEQRRREEEEQQMMKYGAIPSYRYNPRGYHLPPSPPPHYGYGYQPVVPDYYHGGCTIS